MDEMWTFGGAHSTLDGAPNVSSSVCWCSVESASSGWTDVILLLLLHQEPKFRVP
jgi:hypothetical protein